MAWLIEPLVGLGDLRFSMSRAQVAMILDPLHAIESTDTLVDGTLSEFRSMFLPVCNYKDDQLRCLDTHWLMSPMLLDGVDVFALPSAHLLRKLESLNKGAVMLYSIVYFNNIGMSVCNYIDKNGGLRKPANEDDDERGVGVFRKGTFDDILKNAEPVSFAFL